MKKLNKLRNLNVIIFLLFLYVTLTACGEEDSGDVSNLNDYTALKNPELVTIIGYSDDAMEPFISRDGTTLFFNNKSGANEKDIYYASYIDDVRFQYQGPITNINTAQVDGAPSMDNAGTFYYISTASYNPPTNYNTLYSGTWNGNNVTGSSVLLNLAKTIPGYVNFDVEVSPDGSTLYFNDGDFSSGTGSPDQANIAIAVDSGSGFERHPNSDSIMANINTGNLEYAPAISTAGLELFFTRFDLATKKANIYRSTRTSTLNAFGAPQLVSTIDSFAEGPSFSPDEKSLYYHKLNTNTNKFEIYRVTRE